MNHCQVINADALDALREMEDESVDAIVTDPPAGIAFMGKNWDRPDGVSAPTFDAYRRANNPADAGRDSVFGRTSKTAPHSYGESDRGRFIGGITPIFEECLRVLKPGAHGVVWALPRTSHWTATALEDAGFEIRDVGTHLFGSGFPKSLDVSKAIDAAAGAEREVIGANPNGVGRTFNKTGGLLIGGHLEDRGSLDMLTAPNTDEAQQWAGWGTALKPAAEFWILVRKPLSEKTIAANVLKHGTGAINIAGCRPVG